MGLAQLLACAFDLFLQGALSPSMWAFAALTALAAPLGLHCHPGTCTVHSADHAATTAIAGQLCMRHAPDGLLAAETPVSPPPFQTANAETFATRAI
jgi:hypothetical protein